MGVMMVAMVVVLMVSCTAADEGKDDGVEAFRGLPESLWTDSSSLI